MGSQQEAILLASIPLEIQEIPSIPEDARYVVYDEVLYKRGSNQQLLRCVDEEEGNYILREVHEGICGNHSGDNSLAMKVLRQGYYWSTMKGGAVNFVKACDRCQHFANYSSIPATLLTSMFDSKESRQLCEDLKIKKEFTAVYHPQSNGQTEAVNKIIKHTLKTKLEERKGNWPEELPRVLWSYNTTPRSTTGESPFMLTYGYEAMVPVEDGSGLLHRDRYAKEDAEVNQRLHLDLLEETRENS
ncbi:uncharacterized protein LOC141679198 [Apium graveolens]|uniref:uncharacterized protein LOC141679198 n=1 Tax=Apium graveolens TaxID=4045 RepID=UPI003D7B79A2